MATNTFSDENSWEGGDEDEVQTGRGQKRKNVKTKATTTTSQKARMNKASIIISLKAVKNTIPKNSV